MKGKSALFALSIVLAVWLVGCGGGGTAVSVASPFQGTWSGNWSDNGGQSGTTQITINAAGSSSGTIRNNTAGLDGTVSGSISNTGAAAMTYTYPASTYTATGTLSINGSGHLVGTLNEYFGGLLIGTATLDLTRQ